jgi:hypothetical protein
MPATVLTTETARILRAYQFGIKLDSDCYMDSYKRISHAAAQNFGRRLPPWNPNNRFCRIWASLIGRDGKWAQFPQQYRGLGAPGALAMLGWSHIVRGPQIWSGKLLPGAVLQGWRSPGFYRAVKAGNKPLRLLGHSFVFIDYERTGNTITGLRVADNGYHGNNVVPRNKWPFLVGANTIGG